MCPRYIRVSFRLALSRVFFATLHGESANGGGGGRARANSDPPNGHPPSKEQRSSRGTGRGETAATWFSLVSFAEPKYIVGLRITKFIT